MKKRFIALMLILFSSICYAAAFNLEKVNEPLILMKERHKAFENGENRYKIEKRDKAIETMLQKMFPAGMVIDSKDKNFHFRKSISDDYLTGNLAFMLLDENNKPFGIPFSDIRTMTVTFQYAPSDKKSPYLAATKKELAEIIEDDKVFDAKLVIANSKIQKKTYLYDNSRSYEGFIVYCKVVKVY